MNMNEVYLSDYFKGLASAIIESGEDRVLTNDELHQLHAQAHDLAEEDVTGISFLGGQGQVMDGWTLPIVPSIKAMWEWVKSLF